MLGTKRRCPYCGETIELGDCAIVGTNFEGSEYLASNRLKESQVKLPSGKRPLRMLKRTGWPVLAEPPRQRGSKRQRERPALERMFGATGRADSRETLLPLLNEDLERADLPARACSNCEFPLPRSIDERPSVVIGVVGVNAVGKTHLVAASLTQAYRRRGLAPIGCTEFTPDEISSARFTNDYYRPLFHKEEVLPITPVEDDARFAPLVFNVTMRSFGQFSLILHDLSGEVLANIQDRAVEAPFLRSARGIIFVVDPRDIDDLRGRFPGWMLSDSEMTTDQGTLLSACLRADGILDRGRPVPVALTVAKADLLPAACGEDLPFLRQARVPEDTESFTQRVKACSKEVASFLERYGAYSILGPAEEYQRWVKERPAEERKALTFHAVSALGSAPDSSAQLRQPVRPLNCVDPLAAVLSQVGSAG